MGVKLTSKTLGAIPPGKPPYRQTFCVTTRFFYRRPSKREKGEVGEPSSWVVLQLLGRGKGVLLRYMFQPSNPNIDETRKN